MDINQRKPLPNHTWNDNILPDQAPLHPIWPTYPLQTPPSAATTLYTAHHLLQDHEEEEEEEELSATKEMMYKMAAMQPVEIDPATIRKPKRRNVRISDEPQSVAARHRRERISQKMRILQRLVPGATKMDTASMLDEAVRYVKFLKRQIRVLKRNGPLVWKSVISPQPAAGENNLCFNHQLLNRSVNYIIPVGGGGDRESEAGDLLFGMVNHRGSSLMKNVSTTKSIYRKQSLRTIALYILLLSALSIIIFVFNAAKIEQEQFNPISVQVTDEELWDPPSSRGLRPCVHPSRRYKGSKGSGRYLTVNCNGGLNQMRTGISDMVAVAHIMNATLVIPKLDKRSFWQDSSAFSDIFDELHFITTLQKDVRIVKELPKELEHVPRARKHFTSWSSMGYYKEMTQLWDEYQVIHVVKSDSRLANNDLPLDIQRLRCRAMYNALRFSPPIEILGKELVDRLRTQSGKYIALHLRYEKDMLAFTGCTSGLTAAESEELRIMRENTKHWKVKDINPTEQRKGGFCPLTPKEVGIFLQAIGYPPSTLIYVASGEIYGGDARLSELKSYFPNLVFKEKLATKEELNSFAKHATQSAALDYIVSLASDVFVPSYSGNMARAIEGHRRFLGHRKTISPDRKGLVKLFDQLERGNIRTSSFSELVWQMHKNRKGAPRKRKGPSPGAKGKERFRTEESFYENPYHECICSPRGV